MRSFIGGGFLVVYATALPAVAHAEEIRAHATAGVAHAFGLPQSDEFGLGGAGSLSIEFPFNRYLGLEAKASGILLSKGDAPEDKNFAKQSTGTAAFFTGGIRARTALPAAGPWLSLGLGLAQTGSRSRFGIEGQIGYDVRVGEGRFDIGPYVGVADIVQPDDSVRPADAYIFSIGLHVGLGVRKPPPPPPPPLPPPPVRIEEPPPVKPPPPEPPPPPPPEPAITETDKIHVDKDRILLDDVILFDTDSPRVRHASWTIVGKLADFINKNPDILEVSIEGHADATGTEAHNLTLSRQRAESVRTLLVQGGVDPKRVKAEAFGRSRLKVQTEHAEAANRRVEFWITRTTATEKAP